MEGGKLTFLLVALRSSMLFNRFNAATSAKFTSERLAAIRLGHFTDPGVTAAVEPPNRVVELATILEVKVPSALSISSPGGREIAEDSGSGTKRSEKT